MDAPPQNDSWSGTGLAAPLFPDIAIVPWYRRGRRPRAQEATLFALRVCDDVVSPRELAERRGCSRSSVGSALRALRRHDLAERVRRGAWVAVRARAAGGEVSDG